MDAGFCPKNLAFARKIMVLSESGGCTAHPQPPGSYAYDDILWVGDSVRRKFLYTIIVLQKLGKEPTLSPNPFRFKSGSGEYIYTVVVRAY